MLNLYNYVAPNLQTRDDHYPYQQRLRVQCLDKDRNCYIESCPGNKLVDRESLRCETYDICNDRINGYKQNFDIKVNDEDETAKASPTFDESLKERQYDICKNNVSELRE